MLLGIAAGVGIWLNQIGYVYAIKLTTASTTALILGITPIFAALGAWALGAERLPGRFWFAAAVSFLGVALVAAGAGSSISGSVVGDLLAVVTAATWAAYSLIVAPLMRRHSPYRISAIVLVARLDPARPHRVAPALDPELGPVVAGLRLPRLRDDRAARDHERALVHGGLPGRRLAGDALRQHPAVLRGADRRRPPLRAAAPGCRSPAGPRSRSRSSSPGCSRRRRRSRSPTDRDRLAS